jgi:hypothetical protein
MNVLTDNAPRFRRTTDHVESWFIRANDPRSARALWLKATVLCSADGAAVAEAWCSLFDGDRTLAIRETVPLASADISGGDGPMHASVSGLTMDLGSNGGSTSGGLSSDRGHVDWDLAFERLPGALGEPLSLLPSRRLIDAPLPKNKLLTPFPAARFTGRVDWDGDTWPVSDFIGMQGHNWGAAHSPEYAWGQCVFTDDSGAPFALVEGASGRIELGPVTSPLLSMLTVRRLGREYRFDRLVDLWRQRPVIDFPEWRLRMSGSHGSAELRMLADPRRMVCLGYDNPGGSRSHCLNSKTARVVLRVAPRNGESFACASDFGGALEFLQPDEEPDVQPVV